MPEASATPGVLCERYALELDGRILADADLVTTSAAVAAAQEVLECAAEYATEATVVRVVLTETGEERARWRWHGRGWAQWMAPGWAGPQRGLEEAAQ